VDDINKGVRLCFRSAEEMGETNSTKIDKRSQNLPVSELLARAGICNP
jgi:hypothetical protein